jgi:hypothetical protein
MADSSIAITAGAGTNVDTRTTPSGDHRQVVIVGDMGGYSGKVATFRTPGRAGTAGQKIFALHNATGSSVVVNVQKISVSMTATVIKAVTVLPPAIKLWKFTAIPTNGTALTKVSNDSGGTATSASLTAWGDASVDGTGSATTLTVTLPAGTFAVSQFAPRMITAVGFDNLPLKVLLDTTDGGIVLRPLEGICVFLDYVLATQNPVTDMWTVSAQWEEYVA